MSGALSGWPQGSTRSSGASPWMRIWTSLSSSPEFSPKWAQSPHWPSLSRSMVKASFIDGARSKRPPRCMQYLRDATTAGLRDWVSGAQVRLSRKARSADAGLGRPIIRRGPRRWTRGRSGRILRVRSGRRGGPRIRRHATLAQLVERSFRKAQVAGSSPVGGFFALGRGAGAREKRGPRSPPCEWFAAGGGDFRCRRERTRVNAVRGCSAMSGCCAVRSSTRIERARARSGWGSEWESLARKQRCALSDIASRSRSGGEVQTAIRRHRFGKVLQRDCDFCCLFLINTITTSSAIEATAGTIMSRNNSFISIGSFNNGQTVRAIPAE